MKPIFLAKGLINGCMISFLCFDNNLEMIHMT